MSSATTSISQIFVRTERCKAEAYQYACYEGITSGRDSKKY